jgi:two-component system, NarL family, nitrate/nitrite response regulator NarL
MFEPRSIVASPLADDRPRLLLACDGRLSLDLLAMFLGADGGFHIVTAAGPDGALAAIAATGSFDLVLLDTALPAADLAAAARRLILANEGRPVALLFDRMAPPQAADLLAAGVAGLMARAMPARSLPHALRLVLAGERFVPPDLCHGNAPPAAPQGGLSTRQHQVLDALADGRPNKSIARDLGLAEPTVKMHITAICRKLGARNRTQAALIARERGLVATA